MPSYSQNEAVRLFLSGIISPTAIIVGSTATDNQTKYLEGMVNIFESHNWGYVIFDVSKDVFNVRVMDRLIRTTKLVAVDASIGFDAGTIVGLAYEKVPIMVYVSPKLDLPLFLPLADGICHSTDDVLLFHELYDDKIHITDLTVRAKSALLRIGNRRN